MVTDMQLMQTVINCFQKIPGIRTLKINFLIVSNILDLNSLFSVTYNKYGQKHSSADSPISVLLLEI